MLDALITLEGVLVLLVLAAVPLYFTAVLPLRLGLRRGAVPPIERGYLIAVALSVAATIWRYAVAPNVWRPPGTGYYWSPWGGQFPPADIQAVLLPGIACAAVGLLLAGYGSVRKLPSVEKAGVTGAVSGVIQFTVIFTLLGIAGAP